MKAEILEEIARGRWGTNLLRRFVLTRVVKAITACSILILLFYLTLYQDYTSLFFLAGAISGFLIFMALHFFEKRLKEIKNKDSYGDSPEVRKLSDSEQAKRRSAVED